MTRRRPGRGRFARAPAGAALGLAGLLLASCARQGPPPIDPGPPLPAPEVAFPPRAATPLPYRPDHEAGVPFVLLAEYEGEIEATRPAGRGEPDRLRVLSQLQLDYRASLPPGATPEAPALVLALDALRVRTIQRPRNAPGVRHMVEVADDRLRTMRNDEEVLNLRGAQPRERLTPRSLLQRPFALLRLSPDGDPLHVLLRGTPASRGFLRPLPLIGPVQYLRMAYPEGTVGPGSSWRARRVLANPAAQHGLALELTYELAGYERVDGVGCAWILLRGELDEPNVESLTGPTYDRVVARVKGEAFVELATSRVRRLLLEDDVRTALRIGNDERSPEQRLRYRGTLRLEQRKPPTDPPTWSDGTEYFAEP